MMLHTPSWNAELSFSVKLVCCPVSSCGNQNSLKKGSLERRPIGLLTPSVCPAWGCSHCLGAFWDGGNEGWFNIHSCACSLWISAVHWNLFQTPGFITCFRFFSFCRFLFGGVCMNKCTFFSNFCKNKQFFVNNSFHCLWSVCLHHSWFLLLFLHFYCLPFPSGFCCNLL